jgi:hypothetical protein
LAVIAVLLAVAVVASLVAARREASDTQEIPAADDQS